MIESLSFKKIIVRSLKMKWRRSSETSRLDKVRNESIRQIMGVNHKITEDIQIKQPRWYGYVQRMEETRLPRQIDTSRKTKKRKTQIDLEIRKEVYGPPRDQWRLEIRRR